jgi:hypothetical protein
MENLIKKWIQETITEYQKAKTNQNLFKMKQMNALRLALLEIRDKMLKTGGN